MKVSQVMDYMGVECIVRGDLDYSDQLVFADLPVEILGGSEITNDSFHENAAACNGQLLMVEYGQSLQIEIDKKAQEKSYQDGFSCVSYINSTNLVWKAEATQFIAWRDSAWSYAIDIQTQVKNGQIPAPSLADFINNVPALNW